MKPVPVDLAIVIVSWNVWDLLRACLESIAHQSEPTSDARLRTFGPNRTATLRVLVVDNASTDATPSLLPGRFPWVETMLCDENLGFTGGNNHALAALGIDLTERQQTAESAMPSIAFHSPPSPRFVYFLNPDTELLPNSLWTLFAGISSDDSIGAIGPQLRYGDGSLQSSRRRFPTRLTGFLESTLLGRLWPGNPWARHYHVDDWSPAVRQDVDWLVGAALLVRGQSLGTVGGFDPTFFMYSEEIDLCRRIVQAGWRVVYEPGAVVIHYEGRSSEQASTRQRLLFNRSKVLYMGKYFGPFWAELLRTYLLLEFRIQAALEGAKALLGHKRALRQQRIAAYRELIATGLRSE